MQVVAKFKLEKITNHANYPENTDLEFNAVYSSDPKTENYTWSKYTPSGTLKMSVTNPDAVEYFELGKSYTLTFNKVD